MIDNRCYDKTKYLAKREYQYKCRRLFNSNEQIDFADTEKEAMLHEIVNYIETKDFDLYHDFMDDIMDTEVNWFNFICFDRKAQKYLQTYIKVRVQKLRTNHTSYHNISLEINENCYRKGILVERNCKTCEFNFGNVCAGDGSRTDNGETTYGMPMDEAKNMFPNGCEDYGISLIAYEELETKYWEED